MAFLTFHPQSLELPSEVAVEYEQADRLGRETHVVGKSRGQNRTEENRFRGNEPKEELLS